jgi:hypothetical protein
MIRKIAISAVPLAAAAAAAALAFGGTAYAASAAPADVPVAANTHGEAGYEASVLNDSQTYFTHITATFGLGNPQYGAANPQLPVNFLTALFLSARPQGIPFPITSAPFALPTAGRIGLDLGSGTYDAAETAVVPVSTTTYDVVGVYGTTGTAFGATEITKGAAVILLKNVPYTDSVQLDVLYDGRHNYDGFLAGTPTFYAKDLSNPTLPADRVNIFQLGQQYGKEFFHAVAGEVNAPSTVTTLGMAVPVPGTRSQIALVLAHTSLNGNNSDGSEFFGTLQSEANWTVVADASVNHAGFVEQGPGTFFDDHFNVYSGL